MKTYKYKDLFSKNVLKLFSEYSQTKSEEIGNLEVNDQNLSIDIDQILKIMHISVEETLS